MCHRVNLVEQVGLLAIALEFLDINQQINRNILLIRASKKIAKRTLATKILGIESQGYTVMHLGELSEKADISSLALRRYGSIFCSTKVIGIKDRNRHFGLRKVVLPLGDCHISKL